MRQEPLPLFVLAQRGERLPDGNQQPHQVAVRLLAQWFQPHAAPGIFEGAVELARLLQVGNLLT